MKETNSVGDVEQQPTVYIVQKRESHTNYSSVVDVYESEQVAQDAADGIQQTVPSETTVEVEEYPLHTSHD
jgi:hypothetical protein